jgi:RNA polymerase sigma-70 factor (ECF subfamily)
MRESAHVFQLHRPRLLTVARRMLGSRAEAEDILQDVYFRWHQSAREDVQSPAAFLVTITTRLCLGRLRKLKQEREYYIGPRLPEPAVEDAVPSTETQLEFAEDVSVALLALLERLGPEERAAFLLHDVFDYDYREVARILGKAEPTCRQVLHRARIRVREQQRRFTVTPESRERILARFRTAARTGDRSAVMALLAEHVEYAADVGRSTPPRAKRCSGRKALDGHSTASHAAKEIHANGLVPHCAPSRPGPIVTEAAAAWSCP